ncbi:MAG: TGS domain-containing protein, partial [Muribaculaceae bacterium]|nr:TGS domain-containing protein [Muribaculaceae bacterium]
SHPEPDAIDFLDTIKLNLYSTEIFVFTPKGDLIKLPTGSTVLDMAFAIHSDLGLHCVAGKIGHRLMPLSHVLDSGDQVEIISSQTRVPTAEWLELCNTAKAQNRIRTFLKHNQDAGADSGSELLGDSPEKAHNANPPARPARRHTVIIEGFDRKGILSSIVAIATRRDVVRLVAMTVDTEADIVHCTLTLATHATTQAIRRICSEMRKLDGISEATRIPES